MAGGGGRESVVSLNTGWRTRQTIKRGITRKVKLTQGHFIAEYAVPTAVRGAIEAKYASSRTTEFSYVFTFPSRRVSADPQAL